MFPIELEGIEFDDAREGSICNTADFSMTLSQDAMLCALWFLMTM